MGQHTLSTLDCSSLDCLKKDTAHVQRQKSILGEYQKKGIINNAGELADHNFDKDDVDEISKKRLMKMERYERFDHRFPFYKMDVNGFIFHVKVAVDRMRAYKSNSSASISARSRKSSDKSSYVTEMYNFEFVNLADLVQEFYPFQSWNDLNYAQSEFVQTLLFACKYESPAEERTSAHDAQPDEADVILDLRKLKLLGILWCNGDPREKITELYDVIQDNCQSHIAHDDKDKRVVFETIIWLATEMVFQREALLTGTPCDQKLTCLETSKIVQNNRKEMFEEVLDSTFGYDSYLDRKTWEERIGEKHSWVVQPMEIRRKLYGEYYKF